MFGRKRKESDKRVRTALARLAQELSDLAFAMKMDAALARRGQSPSLGQDKEAREHLVKAAAYALIAEENVIVAGGYRRLFELMGSLYPPQDPNDYDALETFKDQVRRVLFS